MKARIAIIVGAGPAGLTAAHELLQRTDVRPVVIEASTHMGGIARTINYKGNRIDIGGHRFFSKSDRVMEWWTRIMPIQRAPSRSGERAIVSYQKRSRAVEMTPDGPDPEVDDVVMLVRQRLSRIYFLRKFFNYPLTLSWDTVRSLGMWRMAKIGTSYMAARMRPRREKSLEDFFINRFGKELYSTFFRDYTEKVWGVTCKEIAPEWGAQRVKGLSVTRVLLHAIKSAVSRESSVAQKATETSLIERFLYPKLGPGQMWDLVAERIRQAGGEILTEHEVVGLRLDSGRISELTSRDLRTGDERTFRGDFVFSTMAVRDLIRCMDGPVPDRVREVAEGLRYRAFITVGLLLKKMKAAASASAAAGSDGHRILDQWVYVQEPDVKVGRLQIFNNWSPYLVADPSTVWIGLEYFCDEGDAMWRMPDEALQRLGVEELARIDLIDPSDVLEQTVIRMPKTYPSYIGSYADFDVIRHFTDGIENLFLIGRNGMHRYNNQDHSMLAAMTAVDNIQRGVTSKSNIWAVNTEQEYHEEK